MTKKIIVLVIAIVLCLSVVGGCFALYQKDASDITINFGSEKAASLTLNSVNDEGADATFNFGGTVINPTTDSATQYLKLNVNGNPSEMAGMYGKFKVELTGWDATNLVLTGTSISSASGATTQNYDYDALIAGITLPLNELPDTVTLTIALAEGAKSDAGFKAVSNKVISVKASWTVVEWAPIDGAYYIIGSQSGWQVNKNAIHLSDDVSGTTDLAKINNVALKAGEAYKVVKYNGEGAEYTWYDVEWNDKIAKVSANSDKIVIDTKHGNNITVTEDGNYFVCLNTTGDVNYVWINPKA